ncbi:phage tail protein [Niastella caeni]|uniref:Phage tail protein n=1 Tax=Niastella caeni TaxID=2569763 RepID=A0A4S8HUL7_9BACT|nr:tail fiber protein [Niastella caeni]THU38339.1 phage tail protein [Niastella caeni]
MFIESYIGIVVPFAGIRLPNNWMFCQGQLLPISQYDALFSLLDTTFGGNGVTTFALPNLCGRVAVHAGQGPQGHYYIPGEMGGHETVMITVDNLPQHTHQLTGNLTAKPSCADSKGTTNIPTGLYPAIINGGSAQYSNGISDTISMGEATITTATPPAPVVNGESKEPVNTLSPYLTLNYIICVAGIYPPHG